MVLPSGVVHVALKLDRCIPHSSPTNGLRGWTRDGITTDFITGITKNLRF